MDKTFSDWLNERPNYKPLRKWNPSLIPLIIERHPTKDNKMKGFLQRTITGDPGNGKSTFTYKLMAKLDYTIQGYKTIDQEEESYKFALNNMIYRPNEFFKRIDEQINKGEPDWIWTLDDASVHMGKQLWDRNRAVYRKLQDKLPTIREDVTCLLITTPRTNLLAKPFREFFDKKIEMTLETNIQNWTRRGKYYVKKYFPDDIRFRIYHPYDDRFSCLIPEPFFSWYETKKNKALKEYNEEKKDKENELIENDCEGDEGIL